MTPRPRLNPQKPDDDDPPVARAGATPQPSREAVVRSIITPLASAIREATGQDLVVSVLDVVFRTEVVNDRNGRWFMPDDLDQTIREQLEFQIRFLPKIT